MSKKVFSYAALVLSCVLALSACKKETEDSTADMPAGTVDASGLGTVPPSQVADAQFMVNYTEAPALDLSVYRQAVEAKGIYVTSNIAGWPEYFEQRLGLVQRTELNAVVIDVKADQGFITFKGKIPLADALGITVNNIRDFDGLMAQLKENNIYTIARIVVFKDDTIVDQRPDFAIRVTNGENGGIYREKDWAGNYQSAWLNPYNREVWDYIVAIAQQTAALGFDEIQFDYVRFPTDATTKHEDFGDTGGLSKVEILTAFSRYAYDQISPLGVKLSADVFGTIINSQLDASLIGQDLVELAKIYDILCPMIYPSHYANGSMGIDFPDLQPYDVIYKAMSIANEKLSAIPEGERVAVMRPWLQDFTADWMKDHQVYGPVQLREQIQACYDAGLTEWLLWNARNNYSEGGLAPAE